MAGLCSAVPSLQLAQIKLELGRAVRYRGRYDDAETALQESLAIQQVERSCCGPARGQELIPHHRRRGWAPAGTQTWRRRCTNWQ